MSCPLSAELLVSAVLLAASRAAATPERNVFYAYDAEGHQLTVATGGTATTQLVYDGDDLVVRMFAMTR